MEYTSSFGVSYIVHVLLQKIHELVKHSVFKYRESLSHSSKQTIPCQQLVTQCTKTDTSSLSKQENHYYT